MRLTDALSEILSTVFIKKGAGNSRPGFIQLSLFHKILMQIIAGEL